MLLQHFHPFLRLKVLQNGLQKPTPRFRNSVQLLHVVMIWNTTQLQYNYSWPDMLCFPFPEMIYKIGRQFIILFEKHHKEQLLILSLKLLTHYCILLLFHLHSKGVVF